MLFKDLKVGDKFRFQPHLDNKATEDFWLYTKIDNKYGKFGSGNLDCTHSPFSDWEVVLQESKKMNIIEALQALKDGKKIRLDWWDETAYIYLEDNEIIDENEETYEIEIDFNAKWEISTYKCVEVKLNDEYTAKVFKDKIVVGCQTIMADKVEELIKAYKGLQ